MNTATIEITKEEAALLALLYKVPLQITMDGAPRAMAMKLQIDGLMEKVREAFDEKQTAPLTDARLERLASGNGRG